LALNYPMPISPLSNSVIDPLINNTFSYKVQGTSSCKAYLPMIYDIDNNPVYTGTKTTLSTPLYNNEELDITIAANTSNCVVTNPYKHAVTMYFDDELGRTLLSNGYFYSDLSSWIYGTNWIYLTKTAKCTAGSTTPIYQSVSLNSNKTYRLSVTSTVTAGTLTAMLLGLSSDLLTNGLFTSDLSGWSYGTNWAYSSGTALCTAGNTTPIYQSVATTSGQIYRATVTAVVSEGTLTETFGSASGSVAISSSGTYTYDYTATTSANNLTFTPNSTFAGSITSITTKLISNAIGSLSITSSGNYTCDFVTTISTNNLTFTPNSTFAGTIDNIKLQLVNNNVVSQETLFWAYTTPTLSINMPSTLPYNLQYYTFTLNYVQAEGIKLKEFSYMLYNNDHVVIDTYSSIGTSKTDYYVDGLASGETYYIQATVTNQMGVSLISDMMSFSVSYPAAKLVLTPTVVNNVDCNSLDLSWIASQIIGIPSDISKIQYVPYFIYNTNTGLHIDVGATVIFPEIVFPRNFTDIYEFGIDSGYTGNLKGFTDEDSNSFLLVYDGTNLVYSKNGITLTSYNISSYGVNYWFVVMQPTSAVLFRYIASNEIYPKDTLYPSDTLYPLVLEDS